MANRQGMIRKRLGLLRKPSYEALLALHGGAGRASGAARHTLVRALGIDDERFLALRNGLLIGMTEAELERLERHLIELRGKYHDDEIMLGHIEAAVLDVWKPPTEEMRREWIGAPQKPGRKSAGGESAPSTGAAPAAAPVGAPALSEPPATRLPGERRLPLIPLICSAGPHALEVVPGSSGRVEYTLEGGVKMMTVEP